MDTVTHIVPLSGGKDSSALAIRLKELYPKIDFKYVITPTGDELPEMVDHWKKLETLLGKKLTVVEVPTLYDLIEEFQMLPNHRARWCTRVIKIEGIQEFYRAHAPAIVYVGLRADEGTRQGNKIYDDDIEQRYPMQEWEWKISDVYSYLARKGMEIPRRTDCGCCFWQRIDEWYSLWEQYPDRFMFYEDLEFEIGATFMTSGKHAKWSHILFELRCQFERGEKPRDIGRREKLDSRLRKQPNFFMQPARKYDYNMHKRCIVCSL